MSRIGKKPIAVPTNVEIQMKGRKIAAKGPLGELSLEYPDVLSVKKDGQILEVGILHERPKTVALWGLYRSLIANIVTGVTEGYEKRLQIEGVGYRAELKGDEIVLSLGYSHPVVMKVPEGLKVEVEKLIIIVSGIDKQKVGQFAAEIRSKRKPEPYKGKGIRYVGEHVRRKQGKRAATTAGV